MSIRYLKKFSTVDTEYDKQIKTHLEKAKKELLSALQVIGSKKKTNMVFRIASRATEYEIMGILTLLDKVSVIKSTGQEETLSPKEIRQQRKEKRLARGTMGRKGVRNVRRNR